MLLRVFEPGDGELVVGARVPDAFANVQHSPKQPLLPPPLRVARTRFSRGFTLLEMLAVIVLLGIVGVIVARSVVGRVESGKWNAGKVGVMKLDQDIQAYALDNGSPPKALEDLVTKPSNVPSWNGPYAKPSDLKDPFGHPYAYVYPGKHGRYDIVFLGSDGRPAGEGVDRDYGNWQ